MSDGRVSRIELAEIVRKVQAEDNEDGEFQKRLPKLRKELDWVGFHLTRFAGLVIQLSRMDEITEEESKVWIKEAKDITYRVIGLEFELLDDEIKEAVKGYMANVRMRSRES